MCGEEPVLRNTIAVAMTFYIQTVRVLGNGSVRGTHGVVSIAVCMASLVVLLGIGHGRNHHTWQRNRRRRVACTCFTFACNAASEF